MSKTPVSCDSVRQSLELSEPLSSVQLAHAEHCASCQDEQRLHRTLAAVVAPVAKAPAMSPALAAILETPLAPVAPWSPSAKLLRAVGYCIPGVAIAATVLLRHNFMQISVTHRWLPIVSMTFTLLVGLWLTVARGSTGLGIPHGFRWPVAVGTVSYFVAMTLELTDWHAVENTGFPHVGCILIGGLVSTLGVYGVVRALKHSDFVAPAQGGALIGIAVASSAIIALHLLCSVTSMPHVLFAHGFSFVAAGAVGAHAGRKWLA